MDVVNDIVKINDRINTYENKVKVHIYMKIIAGKKYGQKRKLHYESERNYKVRLIGNKP